MSTSNEPLAAPAMIPHPGHVREAFESPLMNLPAELRIKVWEEVLQGDTPAAGAITKYETNESKYLRAIRPPWRRKRRPKMAKRYHLFTPLGQYLRVNRQINAEIKELVGKCNGTVYSKMNILHGNKTPRGASRMNFAVKVSDFIASQHCLTYDTFVHIGMFRSNKGRLQLTREFFWPGRINAKEKTILLFELSQLRSRQGISDIIVKEYKCKERGEIEVVCPGKKEFTVDIREVARCMGWSWPTGREGQSILNRT